MEDIGCSLNWRGLVSAIFFTCLRHNIEYLYGFQSRHMEGTRCSVDPSSTLGHGTDNDADDDNDDYRVLEMKKIKFPRRQ